MSAKKDRMAAERAGRKRLGITDYERMADDYAADPSAIQKLSARWKSA